MGKRTIACLPAARSATSEPVRGSSASCGGSKPAATSSELLSEHLNVAGGDDSSVALSEVDDSQAIEPRSSLLEPFLKFHHAARLFPFEVAKIAQLHPPYIIVIGLRWGCIGSATIILMSEQC